MWPECSAATSASSSTRPPRPMLMTSERRLQRRARGRRSCGASRASTGRAATACRRAGSSSSSSEQLDTGGRDLGSYGSYADDLQAERAAPCAPRGGRCGRSRRARACARDSRATDCGAGTPVPPRRTAASNANSLRESASSSAIAWLEISSWPYSGTLPTAMPSFLAPRRCRRCRARRRSARSHGRLSSRSRCGAVERDDRAGEDRDGVALDRRGRRPPRALRPSVLRVDHARGPRPRGRGARPRGRRRTPWSMMTMVLIRRRLLHAARPAWVVRRLALEDLAARVLGQLVGDDDVARGLEAGEALAAEAR